MWLSMKKAVAKIVAMKKEIHFINAVNVYKLVWIPEVLIGIENWAMKGYLLLVRKKTNDCILGGDATLPHTPCGP